jgi:hypothetical protein
LQDVEREDNKWHPTMASSITNNTFGDSNWGVQAGTITNWHAAPGEQSAKSRTRFLTAYILTLALG